MELIVSEVSHRYGAVAALDAVSLAVAEGEIHALIGPSGCGKSTLLGIMGGILQPTDGRVYLDGEPGPGCLNPLTYIFQDFALLPWRTVAQNVALPLEHHPIDSAERGRRVADALQRTGLAEFAGALPKQLSGGMRQRVGIARALVVRPAVLLMDEPFSALDAQTRELLMEDFLNLWLRDRIGAAYVTHNFSEALRMANRVMVLSRRPARIKEMIEVKIPQHERTAIAAQAELAQLGNRLWSLIRDEASSAEREVIDA